MSQQIDYETDAETGKPIVWYAGKPDFHAVSTADGHWLCAGVFAYTEDSPGYYIHTNKVIRRFEGGFETTTHIYKWCDDSGIGG